MAMSRKHYTEVAEILAAEIAVNRDNMSVTLAIRNVALSLADMFKRDNGNFDRQRFYAACGIEA